MPPQTQRRRRTGNHEEEEEPPRRQSRRQNDSDESEESEQDDDGDVDMGGSAASGGEELVKKLVRYALACDHARMPIRRDGIRDKVLGNNARSFKRVFDGAQEKLREVFGMEMSELPIKEKRTLKEKQSMFLALALACLGCRSLTNASWQRPHREKQHRARRNSTS
jgi:hypothetical protein